MPALDATAVAALRERGDRLFRRAYNGLPVRVPEELAGIRPRIRPATGAAPDRDASFSGFDPAHERTALALHTRLAAIAAAQPDVEGLVAVLDAATAELEVQNSDLVEYALAVFITADELGRELFIPPLLEQSPEVFVPSHPGVSPASDALGGLGDEARLDYFREDPDYNAHHRQWHVVYPASGVPDPATGQRRLKDRQGELFVYMHQQMLARYDTERIAHDLPPAAAFADYRAEVEGYEVEGALGDRFTGRDAGLRISALSGGDLDITDMEGLRDTLAQAAEDGGFVVDGQRFDLTPDPAGATLLGNTLEANAGAVPLPGDVGPAGLHNTGHSFFSALSTGPGGVMQTPSAAVRDPVFHRWHRHIDDLSASWQETLPENDLAVGAPPVALRKTAGGASGDIGLALLDALSPGTTDGTRFDGGAFGAAAFGGANWDTPLADCPGGEKLTTVLRSSIGSYRLRLRTGQEFPIFHLDHAEFAYFFRLENLSHQPQRVTVRVFLVAAQHADDRRWWIEMDKFLQPLEADERAVAYRPARLSSVVRKRARRPGEPVPGPQNGNDNYCSCGWPYHMLLPRGTEDGMAFRLLVLLTDAEQDLTGTDSRCGSVSFCGSRDDRHPDGRMMGYPFDRPFRSRTIGQAIADPTLRHVAALDLTIRRDGGG